jgi:bacterioferritin (cytochrome b1)
MATTDTLSEADLPLPAEEFAERLIADIDAYIETHGLAEARFDTAIGEAEMREGLYTRIYNEFAALDLSRQMLDGIDRAENPQAWVHLLKQMEDEAKHARMLSQRLWNLGGEPELTFERAADSTKRFWELFEDLDVIEMAVMLQCGAERMAQYRHEKELHFYDEETAEIYEKVISPEEAFHAKIGVALLRLLCTDEATQRRALRTSHEARELIRDVHDQGIQEAFGGA